MSDTARNGPLTGVRIVEFAGLGPTPFAAMMLADLGADVVRIDRPHAPSVAAGDERLDVLNRSRRSIILDLKSPVDRETALALITKADVLIEGNRPGVMERLGLGPEVTHARHPALIYARMTGWGQDGPLAHKAGHDINYVAQTGLLHMIGDADRPPAPPLNIIGDFGGGALFAVTGILAALIECGRSGVGQVVDIAMVDGVSLMLAQMRAWSAMGFWNPDRGTNLLDGGAYFYRCYATADGGHIAVGAIEPQFHDAFIAGLGLSIADFSDPLDRRLWPQRRDRIAAVVLTRTRADWIARFASLDACVTPVLTPEEAITDPANVARAMHVAPGGVAQPVPAPRFARSGATDPRPPEARGHSRDQILADWNVQPMLAIAS